MTPIIKKVKIMILWRNKKSIPNNNNNNKSKNKSKIWLEKKINNFTYIYNLKL